MPSQTRRAPSAIRRLFPLLAICSWRIPPPPPNRQQGLWLDEAFSVWMGGQPVGEMMGWVVRIDQHPPLYY